jgi:membrane protein YdbS with pleckstrin-like domain
MPRRRLQLSWSHGPRITYDRYLSPGEEVAFEVRRHAAALLAPVAQALGAWIAFFLIHNWLDLPSDSNPLDTIMFIAVMALTLRAIWRWFEWQIERVLVTNKRIVEVSGIITRRVASMPLAKVTDLTYQRGPLARLFNYGELILESAGQKQALESISYIPRPDDFYRDFTELLNNAGVIRSPDDDKDTGEIPRVRL